MGQNSSYSSHDRDLFPVLSVLQFWLPGHRFMKTLHCNTVTAALIMGETFASFVQVKKDTLLLGVN